jgi:hypothetical protein
VKKLVSQYMSNNKCVVNCDAAVGALLKLERMRKITEGTCGGRKILCMFCLRLIATSATGEVVRVVVLRKERRRVLPEPRRLAPRYVEMHHGTKQKY